MADNYKTIELADASDTLRAARRIMVVGSSGGGKSTLARQLSGMLDMPYFSIDRDVRWMPGWKERSRQEQRAILASIVARKMWVIDGSGKSSFDIRLPRTDLVIWIRMPRIVCLIGVARRVFHYYGTVRPGMADGCPEPLPDRSFLAYIWNFEQKWAPFFKDSFALHGPDVPVLTLKNRRQVRRLLALAAQRS